MSSTPIASARPTDSAPDVTLVNAVAARLRDMIIQDQLQPGARIRERQLSEHLNVSRTPLREAIRILVSERLVDSLPNRGAVIANPDPTEVRELLQVLGALEAFGAEMAVKAASDSQIRAIERHHQDMLQAYRHADKLAYFKVNQTIHKAIVAASGNTVLVDTHGQLNARLYRVRFISNQQTSRWHEAVEQHEEMMATLKARDRERLGVVMREHLAQTWLKARVSIDR